MIQLLIFTLISVLISFMFNKNKTKAGIKMGTKMFLNILPPFLTVLIAVSFVLALLPGKFLKNSLDLNPALQDFL